MMEGSAGHIGFQPNEQSSQAIVCYHSPSSVRENDSSTIAMVSAPARGFAIAHKHILVQSYMLTNPSIQRSQFIHPPITHRLKPPRRAARIKTTRAALGTGKPPLRTSSSWRVGGVGTRQRYSSLLSVCPEAGNAAGATRRGRDDMRPCVPETSTHATSVQRSTKL